MNRLTIRRGTTPEIWFGIPMDAEQVTQAEMTITQGDSPQIVKQTAKMMRSGRKMGVLLTQGETLRLEAGIQAHAILRLTSDGKTYCSQQVKIDVKAALKDEVI